VPSVVDVPVAATPPDVSAASSVGAELLHANRTKESDPVTKSVWMVRTIREAQ
jgi:hypothetical protein